MTLPQKKYREVVFQLLYSHDLSSPKQDDIVPLLMEQLSISKSHLREAYARMQKIMEACSSLDAQIAELSEGYDFSRIPRVERNILRLALYELLFDDGIPPKVVISEAMRLTRKFSTSEASKFVNAVLDQAYKENIDEGEEEEDKHQIFFKDQLKEDSSESQEPL